MQQFPKFASKRCSFPLQPPLPIFKNTQSTETTVNAVKYVCNFNGFNVTVTEQEAMIDLYTLGYFGKGSLSSGYPSRIEKKSSKASCNQNESSEDDQLQPCRASGSTVEENLQLTLEEAFFLSHAVRILDVRRSNVSMSNENLWIEFQNIVPNFISRYVAYHYFRAKGWVVRPGTKFGGDFVLYKDGPPFYHASFVVVISSNLNSTDKNRGFGSFLTHHRAIEVVKKDLLICQIVAPPDFDEKNLTHLTKFKVSDYLFKRWTPSENRE